jgi:two-component system, LytTR family, response regulator
VVAVCVDGADAIASIDRERPDLAFLDVRMPGLGGLDVLDRLGAQAPLVVFCTAYDEYALRAFDYAAADYLLKPFDAERLARALTRVRQRLGATDGATALPETSPPFEAVRRLVVRHRERLQILDVDDLRWVEASDKWLTLHARDGQYRLRKPIRELEAELDPTQFARIHRATLIALAEVHELHPLPDGDYGIVLRDRTVLNLSRTYRDAFFAKLRAGQQGD